MLKLERYKHVFSIAVEAVLDNKFRSILTALGIIFGVAAVIAMMAIGNGAKKEILDQMKLVGVNNIIVTPILKSGADEDESENEEGLEKETKRYSPGLSLQDAESIIKILPTVLNISPEVIYEVKVIKGSQLYETNISGITKEYFEIFDLSLEEGKFFQDYHFIEGKPVCIIGNELKSKLFPYEDPLGKQIKCNDNWLTVIGILNNKLLTGNNNSLKISNYNQTVFIPIQTILSRFADRSIANGGSLQSLPINRLRIRLNGEDHQNQLDKLIIQINDNKKLKESAEIIERIIKRRHNDNKDFNVIVPELLLKQEEKTREIFNIVLAAIASISLIVGGIGIMNIMLASILERIQEIGVRLAIGAHKKDVILQFLTESTLISLSGGIIGIILGVFLAKLITELTEILTIISPLSIIVSFGVSASIGILFGYMPARKAANQDPVTSLRHD